MYCYNPEGHICSSVAEEETQPLWNQPPGVPRASVSYLGYLCYSAAIIAKVDTELEDIDTISVDERSQRTR